MSKNHWLMGAGAALLTACAHSQLPTTAPVVGPLELPAPNPKFDVKNFMWRDSVKFDWSSRQLLDLGMIEPGQWF